MHLSFHWSFTYHFIFSWNNIFMYLSIVHCCSFVKDLSFSIFTNQSILLSYSQKLLKVYILLLILVTLVTPLPFIYCTLFLIFIHVSLLFAFFISRLCVIYYVHISFQCISDVRILLHTFILMPLFYVFMKYPKWHVDSASFSHFYALVTHITFKSSRVKSQSLLLTQQFPSVIMLNPFHISFFLSLYALFVSPNPCVLVCLDFIKLGELAIYLNTKQ